MLKLENTYLGYTDNLKPMQKAKIEKILNSYIRSEGVIYSQKEFVLNRVKEGYTPYIVEDYCYYKRDGELTKPKTDYRLKDQKGVFFTINKTLYEFAKYIQEKNFIVDTIRENFINTELEEKQRQEQLQKEKELQEQQEKELKEKQQKEFENWLEHQATEYNSVDKFNLAKEIFLYEIGQYSELQLKKLLTLIDNIENPLCREKLISWLHTGNKASKKVFYHITGIKLPATDKKTKVLLKTLIINDYAEMVSYKPRKEIQEKELKTFYKMIRIPEPHFEEALGEPVNKYELEMFLTKENDYYCLTEARSGCVFTNGEKTKEGIFNRLKDVIDKNGIDKMKELIKYQIEKTGLSPLFR